ncbi:MAG: UDP-N-acetylmuramate--L-alanine ligase [Phycisphaerae bacterium]|nr:UDP-N-acetylmuramate--L-alanine ligase [Gemmatimonadaceae bacterium]
MTQNIPVLRDGSTDTRPLHFIGIAGAGMSALAELLNRRGVNVQGTDTNLHSAPDLVKLGITVSAHDVSLVSRARAVVYSSAIPATHPEMEAARQLGLPLVRRAEALAEAVSGGMLVAVAGTHGKTTTTVMTTEALIHAGMNPTGVVGGRVGRWEGNLRFGSEATFVVEADEYDRSFLALTPSVAVVLNVEADHLDIYKDLADITGAFEKFLAPAQTVVRCADDAGAMALKVGSSHQIIAYSATAPGAAAAATAGDARLFAKEVALNSEGAHFAVEFDGVMLGSVSLAVPGIHNVRNALAAIGSGLALGCEFQKLAEGLAAFRGVERRFQRIDHGNALNVRVIDDYAHHPTEVAATIAAARASFPASRLMVAFQPHLYSRTFDLHREFADALGAADVIMLCEIYGAREQPMVGVTSALIGNLLPQARLAWSGPRTEVVPALQQALMPGDVVITMGAGDITKASVELVAALAPAAGS